METLDQVHKSIYKLPSAFEKEKDSIYNEEEDCLISESDMQNQRKLYTLKDRFESMKNGMSANYKRAQSSN